MKQCPQCGYTDPPYWLPRLFDREVDVIKIDDFEQLEPDIMKRLVGRNTVEEGLYAYRKTSSVVWRIWIPLYRARGGWKISKGYWDPATRKRMNYSMSAVSRAGFMKKNHPKLDKFNGATLHTVTSEK